MLNENNTTENYSSIPKVEVKWKDTKIKVQEHLTFKAMLLFVNDVVSSCFVFDTGEYIPEVKDFAISCALIKYYTDFELPEDLEEKYNVIYGTDITAQVENFVDEYEYSKIMEAIDEKINNLTQSNVKALDKQINKIVESFSSIEEKLSNIFKDIDNDTISKIAGAITNGSFSEDKLVQAFSKNMNSENSTVQVPTEVK